jgi:hypothetical protein
MYSLQNQISLSAKKVYSFYPPLVCIDFNKTKISYR